jgi:hypothetical protein
MLALNLAALLFTSWVLAQDIKRNIYLPLAELPGHENLLASIGTVDDKAVSVSEILQGMIQKNPKTIILEAGPGALFDLYSTPESRKARAACLIKPLFFLRPDEEPKLLACLQGLQADGWSVVLTHSNDSKAQRTFGKPWAAPFALVSQGETPKLVRTGQQTGLRFREESQGGMTFWRLQ